MRAQPGTESADLAVFDQLESQVRHYCRHFPTVFESAEGCRLVDESNRSYLDFFSGAGALNYGHNNPRLKRKLLDYIERNGVTHTLDLASTAKREFLANFERVILRPRGLRYRLQFPGPAGANAVEAALKLARKATKRRMIISFTHGYHGMTLGALSVTSRTLTRGDAGIPLSYTQTMPFDGAGGADLDTIERLSDFLRQTNGSLDHPAAIILETIQAEGGVNVAGLDWLKRLADLARSYGVWLILDDIQVGCGRAGTFFSFEAAELEPDLICLSKSLSGYGLPMALLLIKPELDVWEPGEHTGTFRGHNLAMVTATEALTYWEDNAFSRGIEQKAAQAQRRLTEMLARDPEVISEIRGRGLIQGLVFERSGFAARVSSAAFERGLIIETAGPRGEVLKLLPPLTISAAELDEGLGIIAESIHAVLTSSERAVGRA